MATSIAPLFSMTDFVDIVHQSGTPKATKIKQVKLRPDYHPAFDFYKPMREAIADTHRAGGNKSQFQMLAGAVSDPKKQANYPEAIQGYAKWWGTKTVKWVEPPRGEYSSSGVEITINPELGLKWADEKHIIKLYFKSSRLDKYRVALILDLMEEVLREEVPADVKMSVLDVRAAKLYSSDGHPPSNLALINAELAYIGSLWDNI